MKEESRLYIVCEGLVRGYFTIVDFEFILDSCKVYLSEWTRLLPPIPMKGFQGFRYWNNDWVKT